jgi:peptidoglycan hydrolase CwlO-like protein
MMAGMERIITRSNQASIQAMETRLLGKLQETVRDVEHSVDSLRAELQAERFARQTAIDELKAEMDKRTQEAKATADAAAAATAAPRNTQRPGGVAMFRATVSSRFWW